MNFHIYPLLRLQAVRENGNALVVVSYKTKLLKMTCQILIMAAWNEKKRDQPAFLFD